MMILARSGRVERELLRRGMSMWADPDGVRIVPPRRGRAFGPASGAKALIEEVHQRVTAAGPPESNLDDHRIPSKRPGHPVTAIPPRLNLGGIRNRELAGVTGERDPSDVAVLEAGDHRYYRSDLRHEPSSGITARVSVRGAAGPCGDRPCDQDSGERQRG